MKSVPLLRSIERLPGGMMVVPLLIGAAVATFAPGTSKFFGSFTEELFNGALTILAVFYVCMGTTIELKATPYILKKGGALFITAWWSGQLGSASRNEPLPPTSPAPKDEHRV